MRAVWVLVLGLTIGITALAQEPKGEKKLAKTEEKLTPEQFRVKVEVLVGPSADIAIYQVRVWTVGKQVVRLSGIDGRGALKGESKPEKDSSLFRDESVIVVALRSKPGDRQIEMEQRFTGGGSGGGGIYIVSRVKADTKLDGVVEISGGTWTGKLGEKIAIGKVNGHVISSSAQKPDE
jgi:hypothetical protein